MRHISILFVMAILICSCERKINPYQDTILDREVSTEDMIIRTILLDMKDDLYINAVSNEAMMNKLDELTTIELQKEMDDLSRETIVDFMKKNMKERVMGKGINEIEGTYIITESESSNLENSKNLFKELREKTGCEVCIRFFSRIGLNAERSQALSYCDSMVGPLAGTGRYYFLRKIAGKWCVVKSYRKYIIDPKNALKRFRLG